MLDVLMTWASHIHSPSIIAMLYSMGPSIHMPTECMGMEQSRIGILIRLIIKKPFIISLHFPNLVTAGVVAGVKARVVTGATVGALTGANICQSI